MFGAERRTLRSKKTVCISSQVSSPHRSHIILKRNIVFDDSRTSSSESFENNQGAEDVIVIHEHHHHHHHQDDSEQGKCTINDYRDLESLLENPVVKDFIAEYVAKEKIMKVQTQF